MRPGLHSKPTGSSARRRSPLVKRGLVRTPPAQGLRGPPLAGQAAGLPHRRTLPAGGRPRPRRTHGGERNLNSILIGSEDPDRLSAYKAPNLICTFADPDGNLFQILGPMPTP